MEPTEIMRVIVTLSGGKSSAWCADWALKNYPEEKVVLYFNDTKWEHPDLYRFLDDLSVYLDHPITEDSDGRTPEAVAWDESFLPNNRVPFCSRILKAERLQAFCQDGDVLIFGIGIREMGRAWRIKPLYEERIAKAKKISLSVKFPLIEGLVDKRQIDEWLQSTGIQEPELYWLGFDHNNCSGGCVRSGKKQWVHLLKNLPDVYAERERCERDFNEGLGKNASFMKDMTLTKLREQVERDPQDVLFSDDPGDTTTECFGICNDMN